MPDLDYFSRRRSLTLVRDLEELDVPNVDIPIHDMDEPSSVAEALGLLYVVEGSTLGGRVIRKQLAAGRQSSRGLGFLDPYGPATGERWRGFLAVLAREVPGTEPERISEAVRGGIRGFASVEAWLCDRAMAA